jgi:hypothetical protein
VTDKCGIRRISRAIVAYFTWGSPCWC